MPSYAPIFLPLPDRTPRMSKTNCSLNIWYEIVTVMNRNADLNIISTHGQELSSFVLFTRWRYSAYHVL